MYVLWQKPPSSDKQKELHETPGCAAYSEIRMPTVCGLELCVRTVPWPDTETLSHHSVKAREASPHPLSAVVGFLLWRFFFCPCC